MFPRDKSNDNFNLAEATSFNGVINTLGLLEIPTKASNICTPASLRHLAIRLDLNAYKSR
jgi:hypothetical protein